MIYLIILFGGLMTIAGIVLLIRPALVINFIESNGDKVWLYTLAIVVRILLGWILVQYSANSKFPLLIEILGWLMILAGLSFLLIGRSRFVRFMNWIIGKLKPFVPLAGVFAMAFGVFLVYAFV